MLTTLLLAAALQGGTQISLDSVRAKIPKYGFPEKSKAPDRFMSDAFGVLRLQRTLTAAQVRQALVPAHARVLGEEPLRLELRNGARLDFYFNSSLAVGTEVPPLPGLNYVVLPEALTSGNADPHLAAFLKLLQDAAVQDRFLEPNPLFAEEQLAQSAMQKGAAAVGAYDEGGTDGFLRAANAVLLVPDRVHGDTVRYREVKALIQKPEIEWVGLEMISAELNPALHAFVQYPPGSAAHEQARRAILAYYQMSWNDRFGVKTAPEQNHYFQLIELARSLGKRVYGLDTNLEYVVFRYGEFPLGGATRNVVWAQQLPRMGLGLLFGGSAHMARMPGNVQYFIRQLRPELGIFEFR